MQQEPIRRDQPAAREESLEKTPSDPRQRPAEEAAEPTRGQPSSGRRSRARQHAPRLLEDPSRRRDAFLVMELLRPPIALRQPNDDEQLGYD